MSEAASHPLSHAAQDHISHNNNNNNTKRKKKNHPEIDFEVQMEELPPHLQTKKVQRMCVEEHCRLVNGICEGKFCRKFSPKFELPLGWSYQPDSSHNFNLSPNVAV